MKNQRNTQAVSEVLGEIILLAIAVTSISVIYSQVLSTPPPSNPPNVTIIGKIEGNNLVFENQKGESLSLDTKITVNTDIKNETFLVKKYLDAESIKDGEWNIGEKAIYPFPFNLSNIRSHFTSYLQIADIESNSLVFTGTLDVYPETDLGVTMTADNLHPAIGSKVNFTICVINNKGGTPAKNIEILNTLSKNFTYSSNDTSYGVYNPNTGIWYIPSLEIGQSACLTITAIVTLTSTPTQLAMILDGSGSISSHDWDSMRIGLANAVNNSSIFPHDGTVELTVIQFGGSIFAKWNDNWDDYSSNWFQSSSQRHNNSYSAGSSDKKEGSFTCNNLDTRDASSITVDFWYRLDDTEVGDLTLSYYNGSNYNVIQNIGGGAKNKWLHYTDTIVDSHYFKSNFRIRFTSTLDNGENVWIDDVVIKKDADILLREGFESYYPYSRVEIGPIIVTSSNKQLISNQIRNINQMQGYTPMACGIRLAADQLHNIGAFNITKRQLINLVTDGKPNCVWVPGSYRGEIKGDNPTGWNLGKQDSEEAQSYLLNTLQMNSNKDEFDSIAVGVNGTYGSPDTDWLKNKIVWPQPGSIAPPYIAGWVKTITSWQGFEETISEIFKNYFGISTNNNVKIIAATPSTDPNLGNNEVEITIIPN
jgi:uncharacterized repeat protein (TIGR01451 family)